MNKEFTPIAIHAGDVFKSNQLLRLDLMIAVFDVDPDNDSSVGDRVYQFTSVALKTGLFGKLFWSFPGTAYREHISELTNQRITKAQMIQAVMNQYPKNLQAQESQIEAIHDAFQKGSRILVSSE